MHSRDRVIKYDQRTVVAVCSMKVRVTDTIFGPLITDASHSDITCIGCRAVLREREKEAQRAETPVQRETKEGPK